MCIILQISLVDFVNNVLYYGAGLNWVLLFYSCERQTIVDLQRISGGYMYILKTESCFDSAHFLSGYVGKCSNIHGHRWKVEIQVSSESLCEDIQNRGMVVDFGKLKDDLRNLAEHFDHTLIIEKGTLRKATMNALNDEGFAVREVDFRPTAENFARYFYEEMSERGYNIYLATVYETPNNCAAYKCEKKI